MAAVLCLVFLPALAAMGFMFGTISGELTLGTGLAGLTFFLLGAGIFVGMFNMSRAWEEEKPHAG